MLKRNKITARKKRGQSTIEYIILVAAVLAAILAFQATFTQRVTETLTTGTNEMVGMAGNISY